MNADSCDSQAGKKPFMIPDREVFEITRMGLPLSLKDNLICGLVIVLAIALQIRLNQTFLAEGLIAFFGFVGYVALRYWILRQRYPEVGELIIDGSTLHVPACVNKGFATSLDLSGCIVKMFISSGRSNSPTSIVFRHLAQVIRINSLSIDLARLDRTLQARRIVVQKEFWSFGTYVLPVILITLVAFFIYMALSGALH